MVTSDPGTQTSHEDGNQSTAIDLQGTIDTTSMVTSDPGTQTSHEDGNQSTAIERKQLDLLGTTQDTTNMTNMATSDPRTQTAHKDGNRSILIALIATSTLLLVMCAILAGIGLFYIRHMMQRNAARTWTNSSSYIPMATLSPPELDISISCPELRVPTTPPSEDPEPSLPIFHRTRSKTRGKPF